MSVDQDQLDIERMAGEGGVGAEVLAEKQQVLGERDFFSDLVEANPGVPVDQLSRHWDTLWPPRFYTNSPRG
jgi:hypothetical protein